ncbi:helix-turn-helix domain-containing protein [Dechloromonas sp. H13]|uniref:helix-turn-helix domain-containing protein n=1 Tax=Dechloromonas sp. H13 TaxID=2570193 RepID=UPI001290E0A2|nr:helix-turn-helix domain-containing protein [Dechloromonas sp. H13]
MDAEESRTAKALKLVDNGSSPAEAAKACGISRQAVDDALKLRKLRELRAVRTCSECGGELPADARADAATCSGACRVARARRLAKEKKAEALAKINAERAVLGYPPLSDLM